MYFNLDVDVYGKEYDLTPLSHDNAKNPSFSISLSVSLS